MAGCGCSGASTFSFSPGTGIDEQSNAQSEATWTNQLTTNLPPQGISGRSPYGQVESFFSGGRICRKCLFTWVAAFAVLVLIFAYWRK